MTIIQVTDQVTPTLALSLSRAGVPDLDCSRPLTLLPVSHLLLSHRYIFVLPSICRSEGPCPTPPLLTVGRAVAPRASVTSTRTSLVGGQPDIYHLPPCRRGFVPPRRLRLGQLRRIPQGSFPCGVIPPIEMNVLDINVSWHSGGKTF